jgi:transaldolase
MSNLLDQLRNLSDIVADTGDMDAIARYKPLDATTNPSLLLKAAALDSYQPLIADSLSWARARAPGADATTLAAQAAIMLSVKAGCAISQQIPGRVSTEVDARLSFDTAAMIERARLLIKLYAEHGIGRERVLIKLAATWEGIRAAEILEREDIQCNLTLLFSFEQARACAEAGAFLISPFVGRVLDWHVKHTDVKQFVPAEEPGVALVKSIYQYYKLHDYTTVVMAASFRNSGEILALAGCDRLTISPALLAELEGREETITRQLQTETVTQARPSRMNEVTFRYALNANAMASEKLGEGIRLFVADQLALEQQLAQQAVSA